MNFINENGSFELIDSGKSVNDTFATGNKFWLTPFSDIYISDYFNTEDLRLKGLVCIWGKRPANRTWNYELLSKQMLADGEFVMERINKMNDYLNETV
jgi:hypothetical protein